MRDKRLWVVFLSLVAIAIWGWNLFQLIPDQPQPPGEWNDLPEIPMAVIEDTLATELPSLKRDPFQWQAESAVPANHKPKRVNNGRNLPRINIPRGQLSLILEREGQMEAIYQENGVIQTLKTNSKIGDWRVVRVSLEKVELEHKSGKVHVLSIP